jgi:hypothetical protein
MNEIDRSRPVYLVAPYTHIKTEVRRARFEAVTRAAAMLVKKAQPRPWLRRDGRRDDPLSGAFGGKAYVLARDFAVR